MLDDNMIELLNKEHYPGKQADFEILRDAICRSCAMRRSSSQVVWRHY